MPDQYSTAKQINRLWSHLSPRRKRGFVVLALIVIVASLAEVVSIGAVLPFLGAITSSEKIFLHESSQAFISFFQIQTAHELVLFLTLIFISAAFFSGFVRILMLRVQTTLSMAIGAELSAKVYERTLYQPYSMHIARNSSEIISGAQKAKDLVGNLIQPCLLIASSLVILISVIATILVIQPLIAFLAFSGFGLIYLSVVLITKRRIEKNSEIIAVQQTRLTKAIQEGLGGIRDVIIDGTQPTYASLFKSAVTQLQTALASNQVVASSPRFGVEALGMALIAGLAYLLAITSGAVGDLSSAIPVLGALALGAQRLLPVLQQIYNAYITIGGNRAGTQDALDLLDQPLPAYVDAQFIAPVTFEAAITLKDLGFRYTPREVWVLRHLNLKVPKGSRVGFMGVTGTGKSTLLDIIMGLLTPTEGSLLVDATAVTSLNARAWQAHISHVPQVIYLSDTTIAENIAFGIPPERIDLQRVKQSAQQARIDKTIESWRDGYSTLVGERGVRLSGGQRQRIGIARALYKRAKVIVFDEATSALDIETEAAVMQTIETLGRDITILIVAHRLATLKHCDLLVEVVDGQVKVTGGYNQVTQRGG